jgi:hypothetical protein
MQCGQRCRRIDAMRARVVQNADGRCDLVHIDTGRTDSDDFVVHRSVWRDEAEDQFAPVHHHCELMPQCSRETLHFQGGALGGLAIGQQ